MVEFSQRLKILISKKDITQSHLAKMLNQADSTISQWINGKRKPDSDTLEKIADFFDVSVDYLLGRSNDPTGAALTTTDDPTPQEVEKVIRESNLAFDGAPLDEEDKEDVIEFVTIALRAIKKRKNSKATGSRQ